MRFLISNVSSAISQRLRKFFLWGYKALRVNLYLLVMHPSSCDFCQLRIS